MSFNKLYLFSILYLLINIASNIFIFSITFTHFLLLFISLLIVIEYLKNKLYLISACLLPFLIMHLYSLLFFVFNEDIFPFLTSTGNLAETWLNLESLTASLFIHSNFLSCAYILLPLLINKCSRHFYKNSSINSTNIILTVLLVANFIGILNPRPPLIFGVGYHSEEFLLNYTTSYAVFDTVMIGLFVLAIFFLYATKYKSKLFLIQLFFILLNLCYYTLFRGTRSSIVVVMFAIGIFYLIFTDNKNKYSILFFCGILGFILLQFWASFRFFVGKFDIYTAIIESKDQLFTQDNNLLALYLITIERLPQLYWNLLATHEFVRTGSGIGFDSFSNLIGQLVPSFLADAVGYERPVDGAWILAEQIEHGGGMYILAESYWNLSGFGLYIFCFIFCFIITFIENLFSRFLSSNKMSLKGLIMSGYYFTFFALPITIYGSINSFIKMTEIFLFFGILLYGIIHKFNYLK
jgi:hypothetical protein